MPRQSASLKGRQLQVCVSLPPEYVDRLKALSRATHEPMAHYFREALRQLFEKHAAVLRKVKQADGAVKAPFKKSSL
jgi:predicted DNA-binding protein